MKNRVINKALCVALASALIFGEAVPAMAATDSNGQPQAVVADSTEIAAAIDYFDAGESSVIEDSKYITVWSSGTGENAKLYINGELFRTYAANDYGEWNINLAYDGKAGVTYTFDLVVTGTDGSEVKRTFKRKLAAYGFDASECTAYNLSEYRADGYSKIDGISLRVGFKNNIRSKYAYDVYRSTSPKSGYKKLFRGESSDSSMFWCSDSTITVGKTYYYQIKLIATKDEYIKDDIVIATSPVIKATADFNADYFKFNSTLGAKGVDISIENAGMYNQFDIYRSAQKNGGYSKIKTTTSKMFTDTSVKAGKTYFYKIIPKYYDPKTNKLCAGPVVSAGNANKGVKILLGDPSLQTEKLSTTSVKLSWDKVRGANVYEIWYKQNDVSGNRYSRLAVTKGASYTVKGLGAGHSYNFLLKAQSVSGGKVICENHSYSYSVNLKYDGYINNLRTTSVQTAISSDKQTYVIYTNLMWDRVIGASGYMITAYNNFTGKTEKIAKFTSASRNTCKFRNPGSTAKGMKYSRVMITPYRGSLLSSSYVTGDVNRVPFATGVKVARKTNATAVVSWKAAVGATGYVVYRVNLQTGDYQWRGESTGTSYVDKDFSVKTGYKYYVQPIIPFDGTSNSYIRDYEAKKGYTFTYEHKLGAPKMSSAANTDAKTVTVSWYNVSGAQAYYVYRATSKDGKYVKVASVKGLSYVDKSVVKGQTYYYKTTSVAVGGNGVKAQSGYPAAVGVKCTK